MPTDRALEGQSKTLLLVKVFKDVKDQKVEQEIHIVTGICQALLRSPDIAAFNLLACVRLIEGVGKDPQVNWFPTAFRGTRKA